MPSKKKKYNARFPAGRIKKIMQTDEEIGKVAQAVPVIISRTLELFVESLLKKTMEITSAKNAKTLTPSHLKQCIKSEVRFDFLRELVKNVPDVSSTDDEPGTPIGNLSPGAIPLSSKSLSGYSCFQFSSEGSSSKSSESTSHASLIPQTSQPKFYKEIPIGSEEKIKEEKPSTPPVLCRTPVIQHTGSQVFNTPPNAESTKTGAQKIPQNDLKHTNSVQNSSSSEDEEEPEPEENGYHNKKVYAKTCIIDEDYDT